MALKKFKPSSPGQRHVVIVDRSDLWKGSPHKPLTEGLHSSGGRDCRGQITSRHRGGGHKRVYRIIDFKRVKCDIPASVVRLEYDPNRTAFIALIRYEDGVLSYILAPQRLKVGDQVISGSSVDIKPGNAMPLAHMPVGTLIHNVEMKPGKGGQLARSAGSYAQLVGKDGGYAIIKLKSGETRLVRGECMGTVGAVSNPDHFNRTLGKAGRGRWAGVRPQTRGIAMNPIDHPNGGRTNGGKHWATPWGKPTKGNKTRRNKKTTRYIVRSRHLKK